MTTYYLPDITGQNPDYLQVNLPYYIYKNGQIVSFLASPIFASSLKMAFTDGTGTLLTQNVDWKINDSDIDETAMMQAYLENPTFTDTLIKSVTIISTNGLQQQIAVSYQEFYLTQPLRLFDDGQPMEVTPDLIKSLVTGLADVRQQMARVSSPVAPINHTPPLLPFDINKSIAGNAVTGEVTTVNTVAGAKVIRLAAGAFFADSLTLSYNGSPLNAQTDYLPVVLSAPLTAQSTNKSGIYQYILLTVPVTGDVTASYHAVGGDLQIADARALLELMVSIRTFLNDNNFITADTVVETPAFRAQNTRLTTLENNMRSLLNGAPTYGDVTGGGAPVRRPISAVDSKFHWWTIASLYEVLGSSDIITADQFKGRVFLPGANVTVGFTADVNLKQTRNPISFKTDALVFDPTYTLFGDVSVNAPVYPMIRLVWSQISQSFSGCFLQIGLPLTSLSDQMVVEDLSSTESCWLLNKNGQQITGAATVSPTGPQDNNFVLPDGATFWSSTGQSSFSKICVPQYTPGYLVYSGAVVTLSQLNVTTSTKGLFNVVLPTYFPINNVNSLIVTMASPDGTTVYDVEVTLPLLGSGVKSGSTSFVDSSKELVSLAAALYQDTSGNITVGLNVSDLTPAGTNPLVDVVRYIRAKV